ncbi:MAG TPA: MFS transporter [Candidatus Aphodovivens avicola]|nr:MFS transporter [Candidatus Aphodovivens avicola]
MEENTQTKSGWRTLLSRNFLLVLLIGCLSQFAQMVVKTPINQFGVMLGIAVSVLGMIATMQTVLKLVSRPVWGVVVDHITKRTGMTIALGVQVLAFAIYAFTTTQEMFIVGRAIEGVSFAIASISLYSTLGVAVDTKVLGTAMGFYATFPQIVKSCAPVATMAIYNTFGPTWSFLTAAACMVVAMILAQFIKFPSEGKNPIKEATEEKAAKKAEPKGINKVFSVRGFIMLPMTFADGFVMAVLDLIIVVYATALGFPEAGAFFFSIQALVTAFISAPAGFIQDKFGGKVAVTIALVARAGGLLLIAFDPTAITFMIAGVLCGFAKAGNNVIMTDAMKLQPKKRMGLATSTHLLLVEIGMLFGSSIGGFIVDGLGYTICFAVCAVLLLASLVVYFLMQGPIKRMMAKAIAENGEE